ncbi:MAG: DUF1848 domain-containing protein [Rhodospirillales bacterium]|nr:DUF1848 domain-containing protein [Rhodospirillales bacterium]
MIVSASYRTDIPAFYAEWFQARFRAGFAHVANPYGGPAYTVKLRQGVDGFVFWTRNARPFREALTEVAAAGIPFMIQYTVTGYPRPLEAAVVEAERSVAVIRDLAAAYGPRAMVWRYDPILFTSLTPGTWHEATFARLAAALEGAVDEAVISFAGLYRKTARNLAAAAASHGFVWEDPPWEVKHRLRRRLESIASRHGMVLTVCSQPEAGGQPARCVDAQRLAEIAGRPFIARRKGNRPGCLCAESRDIGAYDTCPHGCVYCYAVTNREGAKVGYGRHDAGSGMLKPLPKKNAPETGRKLGEER